MDKGRLNRSASGHPISTTFLYRKKGFRAFRCHRGEMMMIRDTYVDNRPDRRSFPLTLWRSGAAPPGGRSELSEFRIHITGSVLLSGDLRSQSGIKLDHRPWH